MKIAALFAMCFLTSCQSVQLANRTPASDRSTFKIGAVKCSFEQNDPYSHFQDKFLGVDLIKHEESLIVRVTPEGEIFPFREFFPLSGLIDQPDTVSYATEPGAVDAKGFSTSKSLTVAADSVKLETTSSHKSKSQLNKHLTRACQIQGEAVDMQKLMNWIKDK